MANTLSISPDDNHFDAVLDFIGQPEMKVEVSGAAFQRIEAGRAYLNAKLSQPDGVFYGINTGFGSLCNTKVPKEDLEQLQVNLIRSHACGMGDEVPQEIVRLMMVLKIRSLSFGHSGIHPDTVRLLADLVNAGIYPVVYTQGSLGASGDLAPLAHLSLPLLGEGMVRYKSKVMPAAEALAQAGLQPVKLRSKEGLALLNGTQFMLAYGLYCLYRAEHLAGVADATAALSLDAFDARIDPFHPALHRIRPHAGQVAVAANILHWLQGSEIAAKAKEQVQDPYAFRCIPQVHGASRDAIAYARKVFETEFSSVSDNPNLFPDEDLIISGGNFHGQPLALALDFLALAISELGSISERRIYQLISGSRGLPPFLTPQPGLNSGLMIVQYTAAGIASENKRHCVPASADSIPSSNGQEDHVSMGAHAAVKCRIVAENVASILGMEWLCASQAMEFRTGLATSPELANRVAQFRNLVPAYSTDREMHPELVNARNFILQLPLLT